MPAPVELALATLLPTVAFLPPDLISLAGSLLSQSRVIAASLKPEEEIARTYACAHIACERLKKRLDLEIGKPTPPVKPRTYDKLYKYLDGALTTSTPRTPTTNRVKDAVGNVSGRGNDATPTRKVQEAKTPTTSGRKRTREQVEKPESGAPEFAMPLVRAICKANGVASAAPHIMVGAISVVQEIVSRAQRRVNGDPPSKRRRKTPQSAKSDVSTSAPAVAEGIPTSKWPALLIALQLFTAARMKGVEVEDEEIKAMKKTATEAVKTVCRDKKDSLPEDLGAGLKKLDSNIDFYMLEAEDSGWLDMEWFQNIPEGQDLEPEIEDSEENDDEDVLVTSKKRPYKTPLQRKEKHGGKAAFDLEDDVGAAGLLPGLGTMFQPTIDWLSDERRRDFVQWKKGILKEINAMEMEVS
ncbi:hypothetical protein M409DRAFT_70233 [Zasmidium cellare ATCC 36951]|uniref:ORC6 first cyclin-like domain-containing protein n=1 Tax=Zasmidium cellare ATCC 36951 TaxID=1080233 RepID=A0A6A6C3C7_ZASCE|nr:uncharacterized protein M409DRAFT_70233 [Zasmidium cellare ATCC 36951]KAF2160690.1 hypothetical protein M409DRAFT_70233 [Zasmidium cellare ATCC 36951]